jgi:hypothetical protein
MKAFASKTTKKNFMEVTLGYKERTGKVADYYKLARNTMKGLKEVHPNLSKYKMFFPYDIEGIETIEVELDMEEIKKEMLKFMEIERKCKNAKQMGW